MSIFISFHAIICRMLDGRSQPNRRENRILLKVKVIQGHSRLFILGPLKSWQRTAYRYNNAGLISKVSEEIASKNAENCRSRQPHFRLTPPPTEPSNIRLNLISPESSHWPTFLPLIVWVYGSMFLCSFKFLWWARKDASFLQQNAYRPFKVIQGRWFWHQSKWRVRLPISHQ